RSSRQWWSRCSVCSPGSPRPGPQTSASAPSARSRRTRLWALAGTSVAASTPRGTSGARELASASGPGRIRALAAPNSADPSAARATRACTIPTSRRRARCGWRASRSTAAFSAGARRRGRLTTTSSP
ncbi:unnamed protein product, partial [Prorocentrum cordatum]